MENGIENFNKTLPEKYFKLFPDLLEDLKKIAPKLQNATDADDAGKIAHDVIGNLFNTELVEEDEKVETTSS